MKFSKCPKCKFATKERNKRCPLCHEEMITEEENLDINCALPQYIKQDDRKVKLAYYCYKCKNISQNEVCLHCNVKSYLALIYHDKTVVLNYLDSLSDEFSDEEISDILSQLTFEEKNWIYHNLASSYKFFYRRDNTKAIICIILSLIMAYLGCEVGFSYQKYLIVAYFSLAFGGACFAIFMLLGILYYIDATTVEYSRFASTIGIITGVIEVLFLAAAIIFAFTFKVTLISGLIVSLLSFIINLSYYFILRKLI